MRTRIILAIVAASAMACSSQPVDESPANPTAVFETTVSSSGIAGMFPFETTSKRYLRTNMRREEHATKGTGTFSGFLVTSLAGEGNTGVTRLDRNVLWTINNGKKEYTECPAHGCPVVPRKAEPPKPEERRAEPKQKSEPGCVLHVAGSFFNVTPTGQKRELNGFNTEQYRGAWVVRLQDPSRRTTTSTENLDVWTTPVSAQMRHAWDTETAFNRAYMASAPRATPVRGMPSSERAEVMPPQVVQMMTGYLANMSAHDRATFTQALRELSKIKGYPISTKIEWVLDGNACASKESEQRAAQPSSGDEKLISGIASMFGSTKSEKQGPEPILSFATEVKALGVQPEHDSLFTVPNGYRLVKQP